MAEKDRQPCKNSGQVVKLVKTYTYLSIVIKLLKGAVHDFLCFLALGWQGFDVIWAQHCMNLPGNKTLIGRSQQDKHVFIDWEDCKDTFSFSR